MLSERTLWLDFETTGLDPRNDWPLEVGAVVADERLHEIAHFHALVKITSVPTIANRCDKVVYDMHTENGLFDALTRSVDAADPGLVDRQLRAFIDRHFEGAGRIVVGGANPGFDISVAEQWFPHFAERLHYRKLDVRTMGRIMRDLNLGETAPLFGTHHRALDDARHALAEMRGHVAFIAGMAKAYDDVCSVLADYADEKIDFEDSDVMLRAAHRGRSLR